MAISVYHDLMENVILENINQTKKMERIEMKNIIKELKDQLTGSWKKADPDFGFRRYQV
jgi:hypothetical protein